MKNSDQFYKRRQKIKISLQVTCVFSVTGSQNLKSNTMAPSSVDTGLSNGLKVAITAVMNMIA